MSVQIKKSKSFINITNSLISLTFNIKGRNKGLFNIHYSKNKKGDYSLRNCYAAINFLSESTNQIKELSSKNFNFSFEVENLNDSIGTGKKVILNPEVDKDNSISFKIQIKLYNNSDFVLVRIIDISFNNKVQEKVHSISPLTIKNSQLLLSEFKNPTNLEKISWFKQGWQSWSPCKLLYGDERDNEGPESEIFKRVFDNQDYKIKGKFYSEYCTVITDLESKSSLILGFVTFKDQFTRILLDFEKNDKIDLLTAFGCMDGVKLSNSSINFSEELFIGFKGENLGYCGLVNYAKIVKKINEIKINKSIPIGWCSWYYYFTEITESALLKNLNFFRNNNDLIPIDFILLDDGYFTYIGDFSDLNSKFPHGLADLFKKINNSGFKGGIWTAPFFAERRSKLYKQHRDWFLKNKNSKKKLKVHFGWNVSLYGLDLSNTKVLEYLHEFYKNLLYANNLNLNSNNYPINLFKIDFLHAAVPIEGDYSNQNLTRAQIFYNGVKKIRDAITDHSFLLGCGAPLGPCVGLVDGMRIGEDTDPKWEEKNKKLVASGILTPSLKISLINIIFRSFMHRNFWINDPDCLMIRRNETKLTLNEIRLQLTILGLSGGQILISDDMTKLSEEELEDAKFLIPPYNPNNHFPIVLDAFTSKFPTIYLLETNEIIGKRYLVAIINWDEKNLNKKLKIEDIIQNKEINVEKYLIFDFWKKKFLGYYKINQDIELPPIKSHFCAYLSIIPLNNEKILEPILLSSSLHISQGCCEIKDFNFDSKKNLISINIELIGEREGNLFLKLPSGKQIVDYVSKFKIINEKENIWEVSVKFKDRITIEISLS